MLKIGKLITIDGGPYYATPPSIKTLQRVGRFLPPAETYEEAVDKMSIKQRADCLALFLNEEVNTYKAPTEDVRNALVSCLNEFVNVNTVKRLSVLSSAVCRIIAHTK